MVIDYNLVILVICVIMGILFLGFAAVCIIQEQLDNHKRFKQDKLVNSTKGYMLGVLEAEEYLSVNGLTEALDCINRKLPSSLQNQMDKGFIDYVDYYKDHLHNGIMLPLSNINKDNYPQSDKMVTLPKDFDQACKNFHTREESRWKQALREKINNRKQELIKFGFKENIRWQT